MLNTWSYWVGLRIFRGVTMASLKRNLTIPDTPIRKIDEALPLARLTIGYGLLCQVATRENID
jgi:hypothetical protein